jgi:hypothetical protein
MNNNTHVGVNLSQRVQLIASLETVTQTLAGGVAVGLALLTLALLPFWLLWNVIGPWAHLGFLAVAAIWWVVWRPIRAYRKARA